MKKKKFCCLTLAALTLASGIASCGNSSEESISLSFKKALYEITTKENVTLTDEIEFSLDKSLISFSVENAEIATIEEGVLTPVAAGITTISATYAEYVAKTVVYIEKSEVIQSITLSSNEISIDEGKEEQLAWVISPASARKEKVYFSSTNPEVATVNETGLIKGIKAGSAVIIVSSDNGVTNACHVTVKGFEFPELNEFVTPDSFQMPSKSKCGYQAKAVDQGLYIYVYQISKNTYTNNPDNDLKWRNASHFECEIWNGDFGYGWGGTYVAMWQDGSYYINNSSNVRELKTNVKFNDLGDGTTKVEYRMYINFDNNIQSTDAAYAYIKFNIFDAEDEMKPYDENDFINFKEDRMVHTHAGNSVSVHNAVDGIDRPHQVEWANKFKQKFNELGLKKEDLTLFIGDSYFEEQGWWTNFYNLYANKNVFTSAIGGTKSWEWIHYFDELVKPYESSTGKIKNIVVHLGYNEIGGCNDTLTSNILESHIVALLEKLHSTYPETNVYYYGIGVSSYFETINDKKARAAATDDLTETYALSKNWLTYIDTDSLVSKYLADNPTKTKADFYKDGTHPKNENYKYFVNALNDAGCQIADK